MVISAVKMTRSEKPGIERIPFFDMMNGRIPFLKSALICFLALIGVFTGLRPARAVPSFSQQTGEPCAACHVGAFGPQLKPFGRDFKLYGYVNGDGKATGIPPIALLSKTSFTNTKKSQPPVAGFASNNNFSQDEFSLVYAGRIVPTVGAFALVGYNEVENSLHWEEVDIRHAQEGTLFGIDSVFGVTLNNDPTVQDLWNSTPVWGFPYASSELAAKPEAATFIEGMGPEFLGVGGYAMIGDVLYAEADVYHQLGRDVLRGLGVPVAGKDRYDGFFPYWRLALKHEFDKHRQYAQLGTFGMAANVFPGGEKAAGTDQVVDIGVDANYQWFAGSHAVSAHAAVINETRDLNASRILAGTNSSDGLMTFQADISYSYDDSWIPTIQYFERRGTADPGLWRDGTGGSPDSSGYVVELAYVPFGKPGSVLPWVNGRLTLQYVDYVKFNGTSAGAADHNTLFLNLWIALAPFYEARDK